MMSNKTNDRFTVTKTIYAKRTKKHLGFENQVLKNEIDSHIKLNPDLEYYGLVSSVKNDDKSITHTLKFILCQKNV